MFATVEDLATLMQVDEFSAPDSATATQNLEIATQAIKTFLGQDIEAVTDDEVTLDGHGSRLLVLPQKPVSVVTSVTLDGLAQSVGTQYTWDQDGILERLHHHWGYKWQSIEVVYSHGYDPIPADIKGVCLSVAERMMSSPDSSGIASKSVEDLSITYRDVDSVEFTKNEMATLIDYGQMLVA